MVEPIPEHMSAKAGSEINMDQDIKDSEKRSGAPASLAQDASRSNLTRSNIGAQSMQKLTGVASKAKLVPNTQVADLENEISVSFIGDDAAIFRQFDIIDGCQKITKYVTYELFINHQLFLFFSVWKVESICSRPRFRRKSNPL